MKFEKKLKKLLVLALMGLPIASAFADDVDSSLSEGGYHDPFTGAYVGAKAGLNDSNTKIPRMDDHGLALGLEAGYGWALGGTVLGIDAGSGYNWERYFNGNQTYGSLYYGLGLKFGIPVTDKFMPYVKLGYGQLTGSGAASGLSGTGNNEGLGVEYLFAPHWSVAGEWSHMSISSNSNTMNNNVYTLGVNYYFDAAKPPRHVAAAPAPVVVALPPALVAPPAPASQQERWRIITEEKPVSLNGANFKFDSVVLNKTADEKLMQVVNFSKSYPEADINVSGYADINVSGYTDNIGPKAYNLKLSQRRADAVKAYLVKEGVAADRIHTNGYGMADPVASNKTTAGRAQNRHAEVNYTVREEKKVPVMQ